MKNSSLYKIIIMALSATILFIQETLLTQIPNFQFTTILIILYFYLFGFKATSIIIIVHVVLDNLWMQTLSFFYTPTMLIAWLILPFFLQLTFKKRSELTLAFIGAIHGIIYSLVFALAQILITKISFKAYLAADLPFMVLLVVSNFITILWLFQPLYQRIKPHYETMINNKFQNGGKNDE